MPQARDDGVLSHDRQWGWSGAGAFKSDLGGCKGQTGLNWTRRGRQRKEGRVIWDFWLERLELPEPGDTTPKASNRPLLNKQN